MFPKVICWIFGHKIIVKAYTGEKLIQDNGFVTKEIAFYRWEKQKFCLRCGIDTEARTGGGK